MMIAHECSRPNRCIWRTPQALEIQPKAKVMRRMQYERQSCPDRRMRQKAPQQSRCRVCWGTPARLQTKCAADCPPTVRRPTDGVLRNGARGRCCPTRCSPERIETHTFPPMRVARHGHILAAAHRAGGVSTHTHTHKTWTDFV